MLSIEIIQAGCLIAITLINSEFILIEYKLEKMQSLRFRDGVGASGASKIFSSTNRLLLSNSDVSGANISRPLMPQPPSGFGGSFNDSSEQQS